MINKKFLIASIAITLLFVVLAVSQKSVGEEVSFGESITLGGTTLSERQGGTGNSSYVAGDLLYSDSDNSLSTLPVGSNGQVLKVAGGLPSWGTDNSGGAGSSAWELLFTDTITPTSTASGIFVYASSTFDSTLRVNGGIIGNLTGNSDTATSLSANGANCPAGQYPLGIDASGAVESCTTDDTGTDTLDDLSDNTTSDLTEGTNLYYTDTRVNNLLNASTTLIVVDDINSEAELESVLADVSNVYTNNDGTLADDDLSDNSTTDLSEGVNLYYTDSRVGMYISSSTTVPNIGGCSSGEVIEWNGSSFVCAIDDTGASSGGQAWENVGDNLQPTSTLPVLAPNGLQASSTVLFASATSTVIHTSQLELAGNYISDLVGTGLQLVSGTLQTTLGTLVDLASEVTGVLSVSNGGTGATTLNNLISLGTHTTGNYVATIADSGNSTITVTGSGSETANVTLDAVGLNCTDCIGTTEIQDAYLLNNGDSGSGTYIFSGDARIATLNATTTLIDTLTVTNTINGSITGNAGTATSLSANGANCSAGSYPLGVDASGAVEGCTADVDTQLSQEQVEDYAGGMVTGNTETLITVTYQDVDGTIDYVVDSDLANYSNINSGFQTAPDVNGIIIASSTVPNVGGCLSGEVVEWNGSAFVCAEDNLGSGTSPWADNGTWLTPINGEGIVVNASTTITTLNSDSIKLGADTVTDFTGTGIILSAGALQASLGTSVDLATEVTSVLPVANGGTGATSLANLITLGTDTTGNYVSTIADSGNATITVVGSGTESASVTLDVVGVNCTDCLGPTQISDSYLLNNGDIGTGVYDFGGATSFEIPNGTAPTVDTTGEIALDTTDNQLLIGDGVGTARVFGRAETTLFSFTLASTSVDFFNGGVIPIAKNIKDGRDITQFRCYVDGGTSVVVNISDGTNDTESITCATTVTSDTDVATNSTFTADEKWEVQIGTITGAVDYLTFEAYGYITRE